MDRLNVYINSDMNRTQVSFIKQEERKRYVVEGTLYKNSLQKTDYRFTK